jgi:hypothetical protein
VDRGKGAGSSGRKHAFDIRALARRINDRRQEHNRAHPESPVRIDDALSRILEHDDTYEPVRPRRAGRRPRRPPTQSPGIATLVAIANRLNTTVGDLLGERAFAISPEDRRELRRFVVRLIQVFDLLDPTLDSEE